MGNTLKKYNSDEHMLLDNNTNTKKVQDTSWRAKFFFQVSLFAISKPWAYMYKQLKPWHSRTTLNNNTHNLNKNKKHVDFPTDSLSKLDET